MIHVLKNSSILEKFDFKWKLLYVEYNWLEQHFIFRTENLFKRFSNFYHIFFFAFCVQLIIEHFKLYLKE